MSEVTMVQWPKFNALYDICETYGRTVELHTGGLTKDDKGNNRRNLSLLVVSSGEKKLVSQRIVKGDLDKAAEAIQTKLSA